MNIEDSKIATQKRDAAVGKVDGRRARSQDSRRKIVAAMIELVAEGNPSPTAEAVAARAHVSLRTVFRHFDEMDLLYQEIASAVFDRVWPYVEVPLPPGDWPTRLDGIIARRVDVFEQIRAFKTAIDVHRHRSHAVLAQYHRIAEISSQLLERSVPDPIRADRAIMQLLNLLLSIEAWQRLVEQQGLGVAEASALLRRAALDLTMPLLR